MRLLLLVSILGLTACAGRGRSTQATVDPRLVEADVRWQDRSALGLGPVEELLLAGLRKPGQFEAEFLWRHSRLLVERGLAEESDRRMALDTYGAARSQAMKCLNLEPAWQQRRHEAGLGAALLVMDPAHRPCLAWGTLAWARWIALMGGESASLDLEDVAQLASALERDGEGVEVELGQWANALVDASRPDWMGGTPERASRGLAREVRDHPNDLARHWDLLTLVAIPQQDAGLIARERAAIEGAVARTPADKAIQQRVKQ